MSTSTAATVLAKISALGTAGKTALGLVVVTGVVGVAAAVPAIADPSNDPVPPVPTSSASAQPTDEATSEATEEATPTAKPTETPDESPSAEATEAPRPAPSDLPSAAAFGQGVAADARDGGVDGHEVSQEAHERNALREADHDGDQPEPTRTMPAMMPTGEPGPWDHRGDEPTMPLTAPTGQPRH